MSYKSPKYLVLSTSSINTCWNNLPRKCRFSFTAKYLAKHSALIWSQLPAIWFWPNSKKWHLAHH